MQNEHHPLDKVQGFLGQMHKAGNSRQWRDRPQKWQKLAGPMQDSKVVLLLTKEAVGEAVPHAAGWSNEPSSLSAGSKAEWGSYNAHHQVTHWNVHQQQVDWRAQHFVPAEKYQHQEIVQEAQGSDDAQADCCDQVAGGAQVVFWPVSVRALATAAAAAAVAVAPEAVHSTTTGAEAWHSHLSSAVSRSPPAAWLSIERSAEEENLLGRPRGTHKMWSKASPCYFFSFLDLSCSVF